MNPSIPRRHFLRAAGSLIALPALESLGYRAFAAEKKTTPPKRMLFLGMGFGVTRETWYPDPKQQGAHYVLPEGLQPLARHQQNFSVIQGLTNKFNTEGHWGSTFWLTGANRYGVPGQNFHNSISADQVAAAVLGADTRYGSLHFSTNNGLGDGHGPGLSLAWNAQGKPIAGIESPTLAFHRLFSEEKTSLAERKALFAQQRSILDAVLVDAKRVKRGITKTDADKLDEYLESIRDIEIRISKEEKWSGAPKAKAPMPEPAAGLTGEQQIKAFYDLALAAFQTDSTRVITYRQPVNALLKGFDLKNPVDPHSMSHYALGLSTGDASQLRDKAQSKLLAELLDKLKSIKEADGSTLFDHTCLVFGSNIRSVHSLDNCPTIVSGGASIRLGQHIVLPKDTPLSNLWLTLLQGVGVSAERHGDSTGTLSQLVS
ncbi:MAG: hypothetical protein RLZZ399_2164 [Verrucomicrobiota bacterium]|jgi:hypothetical protein